MDCRVEHVGRLRAPVLVIENAWPAARDLLETAARRRDYARTSLYYPGLRTPAPEDYARGLLESVADLMRSTFGLQGPIEHTDSNFSLVTTHAARLVPFQRVPHYDSSDPGRFALLHYLCDSGGTSFYRHRSTGTETVTSDAEETYIRAVNADVRRAGMPPPQYVEGDTGLFERIASYQAAFNRLLIYRGNMLHSVNVAPGFVPDTNPLTGRLTVNTFALARG
jgi:hypothetical protein